MCTDIYPACSAVDMDGFYIVGFQEVVLNVPFKRIVSEFPRLAVIVVYASAFGSDP